MRAAFAGVVACLALVAQDSGAEDARPRIGVALSGGGARGLAHIGVLQVLDELRVPVDCVTGTSMGAVVGGAYASGLTPAAMRRSVDKTDWNQVFLDRPPRDEISIRRKGDDYKTLFAPEFGLKDGGIAVPKGVIAGISIESYLRTLTASAANISDFSKLPVPYRAVASDIVTGQAVVLDHGILSQAMRASMSIPGAIAPVELDGHLLVDGGIADNLPIDEARKLCGGVVIAVNISTPPLTRDEITSAVSVSLQLVNLLGKENVDRQLESLGPRDVLIAPELGDISSGSFARAKDAIRIGEEAARAAAPALSRYSLPPAAYAEFRARQVKEDEGLGTVDEIRFAGLERTKPEVLRSLVETKAGEPLSEDRIAADLRRIYGRGDFESVDYRIVQESGKRVLVIEPKEKAWGPNYLRFGVGLATDFGADSAFNALVSYRRSWINRLGGEWLVEGQIGSDPGVFTELYQPVNPAGHFFLAPYAGFQRTQRGIYTESQRVADYMADDTRAGIDLGAPLGTWGEARTGLLWRRVNAKVETGSPVLPSLAEDTAGARVRVYDDTLDHAWFARSGQRGIFSAYVADKGLGSDRNYKRLEGDYTFAWSFGRHTFNMNLAGGTDLGSDMPPYESFTLGGPLHLSGYHINELAGRRMAFGRLMYYNRSLALPDLLGSGVYLGGSIEAGWVRDRFGLPDMGTAKSASIFLGAQTFLGPAYFGLGFAPGGRSMVYLLLGVP